MEGAERNLVNVVKVRSSFPPLKRGFSKALRAFYRELASKKEGRGANTAVPDKLRRHEAVSSLLRSRNTAFRPHVASVQFHIMPCRSPTKFFIFIHIRKRYILSLPSILTYRRLL